MTYPAVGFGQPLPASFALTPYDAAASALAWPRRTARQASSSGGPSPSGTPAMPDLDAFRDVLQDLLAQVLGGMAPGGAGSPADAESADGSPSGAGGTTPRPTWRQPERDGRPAGANTAGGGTGGQRGSTAAARAPAGGGSTTAATATTGARSAPLDLAGWNFGPVDMTYAGPALGALGLAVPGAGLIGTLGNLYNAAQYDDTMAAQGIPGLSFGQWLGAAFGLNDWGRGTADPLRNAFDVTNETEDGLGATYQLKPGVGGLNAPGAVANPNYGVRTPGKPMELNRTMPRATTGDLRGPATHVGDERLQGTGALY